MKLWRSNNKFKHLSKSYFEFGVIIVSYPKRHLLYNDAINAATLLLWLGQGEGFKVEFLDFPGQMFLVKWKDLQDITVLKIWQLFTCVDSLDPVLFGHPHSMESKCGFLDEALCAVSGELTQTLHVLLDFYTTESNMYHHRALDLIAQKTKSTKLQSDSYLDELRMEI
jgi:hypothetical protein